MTPDDEPIDDGLADIESTLRQLPLRPPPPTLDHRVALACHPWRRRALWRTAAAAAILALTIGGWAWRHAWRPGDKFIATSEPHHPVETRPFTASLTPISITRTYGGIARDGVIGKTASGQPLERIRRQTVRQVLIVDPKRGTKVSITMPQEDVFVVPVRTF
jgi:hypothetical protein